MKKRKLNGYIFWGLVCSVTGFFIVLSTFFPLVKNEVAYQVRKKEYYTPKEIVPIDKDFGIVIPKIGANSKVIKDVDPFNPAVYQKALSYGVAHAKRTSLPGMGGNMFLFSHSSSDFLTARRYNSIFYLLSKLNPNDRIDIYFEQNKYAYSVFSKKIVEADDLSYLASNSRQDILTLMTCWPPGTSLRRLIVQAKRLP